MKRIAATVFVMFLLLSSCAVPYESPTVTNMGVRIVGKTAYVFYGAVQNPEDGWLIQQAVSGKCDALVLYMVNPGGNVALMFDVVAVLSKLRESGVRITTIGSGLVASAAVPIFVQGDRRILRKDAHVMIHPGSWQNHEDTLSQEEKNLLEEFERGYARLVAERTKMTEEEVYKIMNTGDSSTGAVFFNNQEALEKGIATELE